MEKIDEWQEHYQKSSDALLKAREAQRKRTSALFDLFNHKISKYHGGGLLTSNDEESERLIKELSDSLSGLIFYGLLSLAEAMQSFEISITENEEMYVSFDNNNFAFIYTFLKSLGEVEFSELKRIAKETTITKALEDIYKLLQESELEDKDQKGFCSVVQLMT